MFGTGGESVLGSQCRRLQICCRQPWTGRHHAVRGGFRWKPQPAYTFGFGGVQGECRCYCQGKEKLSSGFKNARKDTIFLWNIRNTSLKDLCFALWFHPNAEFVGPPGSLGSYGRIPVVSLPWLAFFCRFVDHQAAQPGPSGRRQHLAGWTQSWRCGGSYS